MKTPFLLITILLFALNITNASTKIIIETSEPQIEIIIIRGENGEQESIASWRKDNKSFFIESNNLKKDSIILNGNLSVRLYEVDKKKSTLWIDSKQSNKLSLAECFVKYFDSKMELPEFIVPNYISKTISQTHKRLRNKNTDSTIFTHHLYEFTSSNNISFPCLNAVNVKKVCIGQFIHKKIIYETQHQADIAALNNKIKQLNLPENQLYICRIDYLNVKNEIKSDSAFFRISPIVFSNNHLIVCSKDSLHIGWQTLLPEFSVEIYKSNGKRIWKEKKYTKPYIQINKQKKLKIKKNSIYSLKIKGRHNNRHIEKSVSFVYLLSNKENMLLYSFLKDE